MEIKDTAIESFILHLKSLSEYDFSNYSEKSFRRRIEKILADHRLTLDELTVKVTTNPDFLKQIVREVTVNTTELFRDPQTWEDIIKYMTQNFQRKKHVKIWSSGCSNGLEVYSLIIALNELGLLEKTAIYGTDLNTDVLAKAKRGVYTYRDDNDFFLGFKAVLQNGLWSTPIEKYFEINKRDYTVSVKEEFLNRPTFIEHNIIHMRKPLDIEFDLILCRNVLIYFNHEMQEKIFYYFHDCLHKNGALILGVHEGMLGPVLDKYLKISQIYHKV